MLLLQRFGSVLLSPACLIGLLLFGPAQADSLEPLTQTVHVDLGVFLLDTDTSVRVDGTGGAIGSNIDLKHDFGFDEQDRFRIDGYWRFLKRHRLRFMYFDSNSSNERSLSREIHFGNTVFPLNASVRASVQTQIIEAAYEYSFVKSDSFELAGSFGLHNLRVSTNLQAAASGSLGGGGIDRSASAEGNGPLPVIGLNFLWALNDRFYFDGVAQFFGVKIDNYDGSLSDYKLDFVWQPLKYFGVGVGYNQFSSKLDVAAERFTGRLNFKYGGPLLFLTAAF